MSRFNPFLIHGLACQLGRTRFQARCHALRAGRAARQRCGACIEARGCAPAGLARMLSKVFVPGFSSDSLRDLAEKDPEKFVVASKRGFLGIEEVLDKVDDHANSYVLG